MAADFEVQGMGTTVRRPQQFAPWDGPAALMRSGPLAFVFVGAGLPALDRHRHRSNA